MSESTIISTSPRKSTFGLPAELAPSPCRVAEQQVDLGGAHEPRIDHDVLLVVEAHVTERDLAELADRVRLARRDDVVVGLLLLQHEPHRLDVIAREAPVALRVEVAEAELARHPELDARDTVGDLARHELDAAPRRLVIEQDAVARVHAERLAVVERDVVAVDLGHAVWRARVEGRRLGLRHLVHLAEHLGGGRLIEARVRLHATDRLEQPRHPERVDVTRVGGLASTSRRRTTAPRGCRPRPALPPPPRR